MNIIPFSMSYTKWLILILSPIMLACPCKDKHLTFTSHPIDSTISSQIPYSSGDTINLTDGLPIAKYLPLFVKERADTLIRGYYSSSDPQFSNGNCETHTRHHQHFLKTLVHCPSYDFSILINLKTEYPPFRADSSELGSIEFWAHEPVLQPSEIFDNSIRQARIGSREYFNQFRFIGGNIYQDSMIVGPKIYYGVIRIADPNPSPFDPLEAIFYNKTEGIIALYLSNGEKYFLLN